MTKLRKLLTMRRRPIMLGAGAALCLVAMPAGVFAGRSGMAPSGIGALTNGTAAVGSLVSGNSSTINPSSNCDGAVGWHFVLPDGGDAPRPTFVSITAIFAHAGTVIYSGP